MTQTSSQVAAHVAEDRRPPASAARQRVVWLLALLAFVPLAIFRAGVLSEGDTFWQIRIGLLTIAHHAIPATDTFSWTAHGKPYFLNSWGFDLLLGFAYRLAGLPGVALLCALIALGIVALALAVARALGAAPAAFGLAFFLALPLLAGWLSARPQLFDYAAVLALVLLLRGVERGAGPGHWGAVGLAGLLTAVWINLHAAALLGVAIAGASTVALLILVRGDRRWRYAAAATATAAAGCLVNPHGLGVLHQAGQVRADSSGLITEWAPFNPASPVQDLTLIAGLAALVVAWRRREAVLAAALAVCLAGSVDAVRFQPFVVILATPALAAVASDPPAPIRRYLASRRVMFQRCGTLGLAAMAVLAGASLTHIGRPEPTIYPAAVVADIPHGCRLFTTDLIGSYVILARPDVPVSLDTRNNLYGPALLIAEERVLHGHGDLSRQFPRAGCALVPPSYGLARELRNNPGWQQLAANKAGVLFARR